MECFKIDGKIKNNIQLEEIMVLNEKVTFMLLEMYEKNIDYSNDILNSLYEVFGDVKIIKYRDYCISLVTSDFDGNNTLVKLNDSNKFYLKEKKFINVFDIEKVIDEELENKNRTLISLDIGKSLLIM